MFRFQNGFLHTKAFVVDDLLACVGTVNLDHRSILINFEIAVFSDDAGFVGSVAAMLEDDFAESREMSLAEVNRRSIWHRFVTRPPTCWRRSFEHRTGANRRPVRRAKPQKNASTVASLRSMTLNAEPTRSGSAVQATAWSLSG